MSGNVYIKAAASQSYNDEPPFCENKIGRRGYYTIAAIKGSKHFQGKMIFG